MLSVVCHRPLSPESFALFLVLQALGVLAPGLSLVELGSDEAGLDKRVLAIRSRQEGFGP